MIINWPKLCPFVISHMGNDGELKPIQPLSDFMKGERSPQVVCAFCGEELFDILYNDLGYIPFDDKNFISLCKHLKKNIRNRTIMQRLGHIAESVIVRRCVKDEKINQKWMEIASLRNRVHLDMAREFKAVGTGLKRTQGISKFAYNPSDTQKDIEWVNKEGAHFMVNGTSSVAGYIAGIQVKVSQNGLRYVYTDIINMRYEVPLVYFDLNNDYRDLFVKAFRFFTDQHNTIAQNKLADLFIRGRDIDPDAHVELMYYTDIICALIDGKLTETDFVKYAKNFPSIGQAIKGTADVVMKKSRLIVPQIFES